MTEETVKAKVLLSRKRREKEDRIGESLPFRERTLFVQDKIHPGWESNPRPRVYKTPKLTWLVRLHWCSGLGRLVQRREIRHLH
jgi:hypothetical protein